MAKRIVIADDSATIQRAFAMTFGAEDVTLVAARSADEGLALDAPAAARAGDRRRHDAGPVGLRSVRCRSKLIRRWRRPRSTCWRRRSSPTTSRAGGSAAPTGTSLKPFDTAAIIEKVHEALAKGPTEVAQPPAPAPLAGRLRSADAVGRALGDPAGLSTSLAAAERRRRVRRDQRRHVAADARGRRARGRGRVCRGAGRAGDAGGSSRR